MTLQIDTFWEQFQSVLAAQGWSLLVASRYDPTHVEGFTPTGKAFVLDANNTVITLTIAGRVRTVNRAKALWESGDATIQALLDAWNAFPVSQQ
jgi:hypothetical protein